MKKLLPIINYTLLIIIITTNFSAAQVKINYKSFLENDKLVLSDGWKYSISDSSFAEIKDSSTNDWIEIQTTIFSDDNIIPVSTSKVLFYKKFYVDSTMYGKPVGLDFLFFGGIKIYLNDKLIFTGIFNDGKPVLPVKEILSNDSLQTLKVELNTEDSESFLNKGLKFGFEISLVKYDERLYSRVSTLSALSTRRNIFLVITLVLAVFHSFLYIFNKQKKNNLFYVLFLFFFAFFLFGNYVSNYSGDAGLLLFYIPAVKVLLMFIILSASTAIYTIFKPLPKYYKYFWIYSVVIGIAGYFSTSIIFIYLTFSSITFFSVWGSWYLFGPAKGRRFDEKIIKSGFAIMATGGILQMLYALKFVIPFFGINDIYFFGVIIFVFSMSIAFAYDFASTSKNLEKKLEEVKILSEKTIEQERFAQEHELKRKLLEADNNRKTKELEEARSLQLSMLPACLNNIPGIDICFDMKTATEVGGDYYDYFFSNDGTLNIAIGDATGHGTKAGLMVATIKSLFNALGAKMMIPDFFNRCTEIIKTMNLGNLFMSMAVVRYKNNKLIVSSAGMPPIFIYKKNKNEVEEILIKSMPLGAHKNFKYYEEESELESGDVILMMSDGFPELFNEKREMLGYEKVKELLILHFDKTAGNINRELFKAVENWRGARAQDDDITFVVIKII